MKYLIRVQAGYDCFIADPGRTTIRTEARVFSNKRFADKHLKLLKVTSRDMTFIIETIDQKTTPKYATSHSHINKIHFKDYYSHWFQDQPILVVEEIIQAIAFGDNFSRSLLFEFSITITNEVLVDKFKDSYTIDFKYEIEEEYLYYGEGDGYIRAKVQYTAYPKEEIKITWRHREYPQRKLIEK